MRGRGFTLIEVLIALALLVTMLSLVGPALMGRLAPMTFDRTSGQLGAAVRLARERARLDGVVLYLYAETDAPGGIVKLVTRRDPTDDETFGEVAGIGGIAAPRLDENAAGPADRTGDRDVLLELPDGYRFMHEPPAGEGDGFGMMPPDAGSIADPIGGPGAFTPGAAPTADLFQDEPDAGPDLIAVCLPDGSIAAPRPVWLVDRDGRAALLRIDGAVGSVRVTMRAEPRGTVEDLVEPPAAPPSGAAGGGIPARAPGSGGAP